MLTVKNLNVYFGSQQVLDNVSLDLPGTMMAGLIGRNGAGKTTFMRAVMGLIDHMEGDVEFDAVNLSKSPTHARAGMGFGYMPEDRKLVPEFTVQDNVMLPAWSTKMAGAEERLEWVYSLIPEVANFRERRANQLSGGQQKLVALARALLCGNKILLLDEPFEGVAPALAQRLAQIIFELKKEGMSVLIADSNEQHVRELIERTFTIERGTVTVD
jgi:branched-chain amino acid transport system ATP-binding protein